MVLTLSLTSAELRLEDQINKHPTFSRLKDTNKKISTNTKESGSMWDIIHSLLKNNRKDFPTGNALQRYKNFFQAIYFQIKAQFRDIIRSDGSPYLYHLLETAYILLEESDYLDCDIETIFIALLHDLIEDTTHTYDTLKTFLGEQLENVAFGVHIISKPPFYAYIQDEVENQKFMNCLSKIDRKNIDPSGNIINIVKPPALLVE